MSRTLRAPGQGFFSDEGVPVLVEVDHALPLVDIEVAFRMGSHSDPPGKEGLSRLLARMVRMGCGRLRGADVEERIARLGAQLSVEAGGGTTRFQGTVIRRNVEPFVALLGELLRAPALRAADLAQVKRETIADLLGLRDHDQALAARHFRSLLFGDHPYGRPTAGTPKSVRSVSRGDLLEHHARCYRLGDMTVGAAGDIEPDEVAELVHTHLSGLPRGRPTRPKIPAPKLPKGRRVRVIDKPERTQTQLYLGTLGSRFGDPHTFPLQVANTAFGGMFTGRLMHEVRAVRGYSYGVSSAVGRDVQREAFLIHTFPSAKDTVACTELVLSLYESFVQDGLTASEVRSAQSFLVRSHCFEVDTAAKRLDGRLNVELYGLPPEHITHYEKLVAQVKRDEVCQAVKARLSARDMAITIVATASEVCADLERLPGVTELSVVPYDL